MSLFLPKKTLVLIPALAAPFVAADHFKKDLSAAAPVKISYLGDNLTQWFLGQTVPVRDACVLESHTLVRNSLDEGIIAELGSTRETDIAALFHLMSQQPNGEDGVLLTNGYANIFYCKDASGSLCAVYAVWDGDGWDVDVDRVDGPGPWVGGRRVFSRNS